jgi:hypothetical protein
MFNKSRMSEEYNRAERRNLRFEDRYAGDVGSVDIMKHTVVYPLHFSVTSNQKKGLARCISYALSELPIPSYRPSSQLIHISDTPRNALGKDGSYHIIGRIMILKEEDNIKVTVDVPNIENPRSLLKAVETGIVNFAIANPDIKLPAKPRL